MIEAQKKKNKYKQEYELEIVCQTCGVRAIDKVDFSQYEKYKNKQPFPSICSSCFQKARKKENGK